MSEPMHREFVMPVVRNPAERALPPAPPAIEIAHVAQGMNIHGYFARGAVAPLAFLEAVSRHAGAFDYWRLAVGEDPRADRRIARGLGYVRYVSLRRVRANDVRVVEAYATRSFEATYLDLRLARDAANRVKNFDWNETRLQKHIADCAECTDHVPCKAARRSFAGGPWAVWRREGIENSLRLALEDVSERGLLSAEGAMRRRIAKRLGALAQAGVHPPAVQLRSGFAQLAAALRATGAIAAENGLEPKRHHLGVAGVHYGNGRLILADETTTDLRRGATDNDFFYETLAAQDFESLDDEDLIACGIIHPDSIVPRALIAQVSPGRPKPAHPDLELPAAPVQPVVRP